MIPKASIDKKSQTSGNDFLLVEVKEGLTLPLNKADWNETGKIKIDHRSWVKGSVYGHIDAEKLNEVLVGYIFMCAENEFLRWSDEDAKKAIERALSIMRYSESIPAHTEWADNAEFEEFALSRLIEIIKSDENLNILEVLQRAEALNTEAELSENKKLVQIYERIIYELTECSLKDFESLKEEIKFSALRFVTTKK